MIKNPYITAAKVLGPVVLIGVLFIGHKMAVNAAETKGFDSRNEEVRLLTKEKTDALADVDTLTGDLTRCRGTKAQAEADVKSLNSKLLAQAEENAAALTKQTEQFAATQAVTGSAMNTLAKNTKANDIDFASILEQLKGVTYDYDEDTNRCIIRGGKRLLRDAARGRTAGNR